MRKFILASFAVAAFIPSVAMAQEQPSTTSSFRGFRIEGDVGADRFHALGTRNTKLGYGATVGFDGSIGDRIVIGPEASWWRANNFSENCAAGVIGGSVCTKSFEEFGAAVRAGYLVTPNILVFGKGGYASNEQRKRFDAPAGETSFYDHYHTDGYQYGGGVEMAMADRFKGPLSGLSVNAQFVRSEYNDHTRRDRAMVGVGFHFK
jgi:outer membrane immunogenic protein